MCDKAHFDKLEGRVDRLELDFVKHSASSEVQIANLLKLAKYTLWCFGALCLLMLLTIIYGAVGERGFNHVTCTAREMTQAP